MSKSGKTDPAALQRRLNRLAPDEEALAAAGSDKAAVDRARLAARIATLGGAQEGDSAGRAGSPPGSRLAAQVATWLTAAGHHAAAHAREASRAGARFATTRAAPVLADASKAVAEKGRGLGRTAAARTADASRAGWRFTAEQVLPWLGRAADRVRMRLRPAELKEDYRRLLLFTHTHALDRDVESVAFAKARVPAPLRRRAAGPAEWIPGDAARPTPDRVFRWAMSALPEPPVRFAFVDLGAGRGRALLLASAHPFERIVGIEADPDLHNDCEMNIAQYPRSRMACRQVECLLGNAESVPIPDQPTVFYQFGPLEGDALALVVKRIAQAYAREPRRLYFICVGVRDMRPVEESPIFEAVPLERRLAFRIRTFSPYPVAVFRSLA